MSCYVSGHKNSGGRNFPFDVMFVCNETLPPPRHACATCHADALSFCDWPVMKTVSVPIGEAKVGDPWITKKNGKRGRIVEINEGSGQVWVLIPGHRDPYPYAYLWANVTFLTERPGICDAPACDLHAREVGEDVHYCAVHWNSWEVIS